MAGVATRISHKPSRNSRNDCSRWAVDRSECKTAAFMLQFRKYTIKLLATTTSLTKIMVPLIFSALKVRFNWSRRLHPFTSTNRCKISGQAPLSSPMVNILHDSNKLFGSTDKFKIFVAENIQIFLFSNCGIVSWVIIPIMLSIMSPDSSLSTSSKTICCMFSNAIDELEDSCCRRPTVDTNIWHFF